MNLSFSNAINTKGFIHGYIYQSNYYGYERNNNNIGPV